MVVTGSPLPPTGLPCDAIDGGTTVTTDTAQGGGQATPPPPTPPPSGRPPLRRPRDGGLLAGVCAGLANHLGVDVVLVRIVVVVLTVATSGLGLVAYVLGAIFIPRQDPAEPGAPVASRTVGTTGEDGREPLFWLGIGLLVVGVLWLLGGPLEPGRGLWFGLGGGLIWPLVLIGFGLALWRAGDRRDSAGTPPIGTGAAPSAPPVTTTRPVAATWQPTQKDETIVQTSAQTTDTVPLDRPQGHPGGAAAVPPAGVPSSPGAPGGAGTPGAAGVQGPPTGPPPVTQGGGDWTPPPVPERQRSVLGRLTLGLALLVAGTLWITDLLGATSLGLLRIIATALLVLGLGLLTGSVVGRARWLAIPALLLAPIVLVGAIAPANVFRDVVDARGDGVGEVIERPARLDDVEGTYELGAGSIQLDLRGLDLDELTAAGTTAIRVQVGAGEIRVSAPDDVRVVARARVGIGEARLLGASTIVVEDAGATTSAQSSAGFGIDRRATHVPEDDAAPTIELDLQVGLGTVRVDLDPRSEDVEPGPDGDVDEGAAAAPHPTLPQFQR
jgi:phage shock protein PspC (stress-responsive transcriptional regulator)